MFQPAIYVNVLEIFDFEGKAQPNQERYAIKTLQSRFVDHYQKTQHHIYFLPLGITKQQSKYTYSNLLSSYSIDHAFRNQKKTFIPLKKPLEPVQSSIKIHLPPMCVKRPLVLSWIEQKMADLAIQTKKHTSFIQWDEIGALPRTNSSHLKMGRNPTGK